MRFLETNVVLRYLTGDDPAKAQACYELFQRAQRGDEELFTTESVAAEVAYVVSSPRGPYRLGHAEIASRLHPILALRGVRLPRKQVCLRALDFFAQHDGLDIEDALAPTTATSTARQGSRASNHRPSCQARSRQACKPATGSAP